MSVTTNQRIATMRYLVENYDEKEKRLGKTILLKSMFVLQDLFEVPLDYSYQIYLYGPYSAGAVRDLEWASYNDFLDMLVTRDRNYNNFYDLSIPDGERLNNPNLLKFKVELTKVEQKENEDFLYEHKDKLESFLKIFRGKATREFELYSTIVFLYNRKKDEFSIYDILSEVKEIKPHFDEEEIKTAYEYLKTSTHLFD